MANLNNQFENVSPDVENIYKLSTALTSSKTKTTDFFMMALYSSLEYLGKEFPDEDRYPTDTYNSFSNEKLEKKDKQKEGTRTYLVKETKRDAGTKKSVPTGKESWKVKKLKRPATVHARTRNTLVNILATLIRDVKSAHDANVEMSGTPEEIKRNVCAHLHAQEEWSLFPLLCTIQKKSNSTTTQKWIPGDISAESLLYSCIVPKIFPILGGRAPSDVIVQLFVNMIKQFVIKTTHAMWFDAKSKKDERPGSADDAWVWETPAKTISYNMIITYLYTCNELSSSDEDRVSTEFISELRDLLDVSISEEERKSLKRKEEALLKKSALSESKDSESISAAEAAAISAATTAVQDPEPEPVAESEPEPIQPQVQPVARRSRRRRA